MGKDLSELQLSDGFLFRMTFLDAEVCQEFLTALLGDKIGRIESVRAEVSSQPEDNSKKGVRFDIVAEGSGEISVVEMQVLNQHNLLARTKVYGGHAAMLSAPKGDNTYKRVKKSFVIFICMFDPGAYGVPIYERVQMLQPVGLDASYQSPWDDGSYLFLLNAKYDVSCGNVAIEQFLDYVRTGDLPECNRELLVSRVANRVELVKGSPTVRKEYEMYELLSQAEVALSIINKFIAKFGFAAVATTLECSEKDLHYIVDNGPTALINSGIQFMNLS